MNPWLVVAGVFLAQVVIAAICGGGRVAAEDEVAPTPGRRIEDASAAALDIPPVLELDPSDVVLNDLVAEFNRRARPADVPRDRPG